LIIGNDIIDLSIALKKPRISDPRFLSKIFAEEELEQLRTSHNPELAIWIMWAMKEAAYKAHQRIFKKPPSLNPTTYRCNLEERCVLKADSCYPVKWEITLDHIYCYSSDQHLHHAQFPFKISYKNDIINEVAKVTTFSSNAIALHKNATGVPSIIFEGCKEPIPISITHHGRFAAICFPLINC